MSIADSTPPDDYEDDEENYRAPGMSEYWDDEDEEDDDDPDDIEDELDDLLGIGDDEEEDL